MATEENIPGIGRPRGGLVSAEKLNTLKLELRDFDETVRMRAAFELGECGDPAAVELLLGRLRIELSHAVRAQVAESLYRTSDERAWPALARSLADDPDPAVRQKVAELLASTGEPKGALVLSKSLTHDPDPVVRQKVAELLVSKGDPEYTLALSKALIDDSEPVVRQKVAEQLGLSGNPSFAPVLVQALKDSNSKVVREAVTALGLLKNPAVIKDLIRGLGDYRKPKYSPSRKPRPDAYFDALVAMGPMVAKAVLESAGDLPKYSVSRVQGEVFSFTGGYRYIDDEQGYKLVDNASNRLMLYVSDFYEDRIRILLKVGTPVFPTIAECAKPGSAVAIQIVAVRVLEKLKKDQATNLLRQLTGNGYATAARWLALSVLETRGSDKVDDIYIDLARHHDDEMLRIRAICFLENARAGKALFAFREVAENERSTAVRQRVIEALGKLGDVQSVPLLGEMSWNQDVDGATRAVCVRSLGKIGDHSGVLYVRSALGSDVDPRVRAEAAISLGRLLGYEAVETLRTTINTDDDPQVKEAAAKAMTLIDANAVGRSVR